MRKYLFVAALILLSVSCSSLEPQHADIRIKYHDGIVFSEENVSLKPEGDHYVFRITEKELARIDTLLITPAFARAEVGEEGYFIDSKGTLTRFLKRKDRTAVNRGRHPLALQGYLTPRGCYLAYFPRYRFDINTILSLEDGKYTSSLCYVSTNVPETYGDFEIAFYPLTGSDANYSGMARLYRKLYVETNPDIRPLKEKVKDRPLLKYAVDYPEIRIRQCWKPVPCPTGPDQTVENEPALNVRVTFDRVCDIVDALKKEGVDRAQLTLVGWNLKGHDGRFPTVFPPESELGGEARLLHLVQYAQENGFQIVPHICTGDAYRISEDWDENLIAKRPDGSLHDSGFIYGAGRMFKTCPQATYERIIQPMNDKLREYGFRGLEYNDVYSIIDPVRCFDPKHPLNAAESTEYIKKILLDGIAKIGGIASEGGYDHVADVLDFCLYTRLDFSKLGTGFIDAIVPVWNIVYNGYIFSCPFSQSVNYPVKDPSVAMKIQEFGGHPTFYYYSAHRDDARNWIGTKTLDLLCSDDAELEASVKAIKVGYDYLKEYGDLQYETMEDHREIAPGVFRTTYGNGAEAVCNYSEAAFRYKDVAIPAKGWRIFR